MDPVEEVERVFAENGFDWLDDEDFEDGHTDGESCWRRPFTFTEIAEGYAVERERIRGDRPSVTDELVEHVADGGMRVVKSLPGSGKTTICKSVAYRWHEQDDTGPVLYRKSGAGRLSERPPLFERALERATARGPVLVVVEDAPAGGPSDF